MRYIASFVCALVLSFAVLGGSGSAKAAEMKIESLIPQDVVLNILTHYAEADDVAEPFDALVQWAVANSSDLKHSGRTAAYEQALANMDFYGEAIVHFAQHPSHGVGSDVYKEATIRYAKAREDVFAIGRELLFSYGRRAA